MRREYFLGANTKDGFTSLFDELYHSDVLYVVKGGPGSGKSTFMWRIAEAAEEAGHEVEYILCGSDPCSLDGFIDCTSGVAMCDGTPPHAIEPKYPGAYEITVNLSDMWDVAALRVERERIVSLNVQTAECHKSCTAYVRAAAVLLADAAALTKRHIDGGEVSRFADEVSARWEKGCGCETKKRFISAVSVGTIVLLSGTVEALSDTVYAVDDDAGAVAEAVMREIAGRAREVCQPAVVCFDPVMGTERVGHVILPDCRTAVVKRGIRSKREYAARTFETTPASRFLRRSYDVYAAEVRELAAMASNLLGLAAQRVETAKRIHDELESVYKAAMDFDALDGLTREYMHRLTQ